MLPPRIVLILVLLYVQNEPCRWLMQVAGNGVLQQLNKVNVSLSDIHNLFLTHAHTDHVLGAVWVGRLVMQLMRQDKYNGVLHIGGHDKVLGVLRWICVHTLPQKLTKLLDDRVLLHEVRDGDTVSIESWQLKCFDIRSTKEKQFGFRLNMREGQVIACLGDEPYNEANRQDVSGADLLLCEAFCLYADRDIFHPYEKHHSTVLDAAKLASELHVKNLLLYHTEDKSLAVRKQKYVEEAKAAYDGAVFVPDDLETITFE